MKTRSVEDMHVSLAVVLAVLLVFCQMPSALSAADRAERVYPLAMCSNDRIFTNPAYPPAMLDTGARVCRTDLSFSAVRRNPGEDPSSWNLTLAEAMRKVHSQYPQLDWLPILGYGTMWAGDPKFAPSGRGLNAPQSGIDLPVTDPNNYYGNYVYQMVRRYKDCAHYWESWNEPDLVEHHYFKGNGADFLPYQRACYFAAKKADPTCKVLFAGVCYRSVEGYLTAHHLPAPTIDPAPASFFEEYLQACVKDPQAKANNYYFDIMNQHSYTRASDMYDYVSVDRKLMQDYLGEQKPVWVTEMGSADKGGMLGLSPDEYCDYILQSFAWGSLANVQRFFHFQLDDSNGHGLYYRTLNEPKPALTTYRDILRADLADAKFTGQLHGSKGVGFLEGHSPFHPNWKAGYNLFQFESLDGKRNIFIAFSDTDKPVDIKVPAKKNKATLVDRHNVRTPLTASGGFYTVHLAGATNVAGFPILKDNPKAQALGQPEHLVGGATQLVIE